MDTPWKSDARGIAGLAALAPSPVETKVSVVFRLPNCGVAVTEQQLKTGVAKFVVAADIDQRRRSRLRCRRPFRSVIKDLGSQGQPLAQIPLHQPAREWKIAKAGCIHQRHAAAPVGGPWAKRFLRPQRH